MPTYHVPLWEGQEQVVFRVEAASREEAFELAKAHREQRFQENTKREDLEARKKEIEKEVNRTRFARTKGVVAGLDQSVTDVFHGLADAANGCDLAIADTGIFGEGVAKWLSDNRDAIQTSNNEVASNVQERVLGRNLTDNERKINDEMSERNVGIASMGWEMLAGAGVGSKVLKASTMPRMIGAGALEGFASAFLFSESEQKERQERLKQRAGEATVGAALGGGLATVPGIFAGVKNLLIRRLRKATGDLSGQRQSLADIGVDSATLGQLSGDPRILHIERESAGAIADTMLRRQAQQAREGIARNIGVDLPEMSQMTRGSRQVIQDGLNKVSTAIGGMRRARNKQFENALNQLHDSVDGRPVININQFATDTNDVLQGVLKNYNVNFSKPFVELVDEVNTALASGGATPKQINSWMLRLGQIKKGGYGVFDMSEEAVRQAESTYRGHAQVIANQMKKSLEDGIENAARSLGPGPGDELLRIRQQYAQQSQEIAGIEQDFMNALGLKGSPNQILRKLAEADPDNIDTVMGAVERIPGGVAWRNSLASALFRQSVNDGSRAATTFAQKAGDFNLKAFAESLGDNAKRTKLGGILRPDQEKNLVQSLNSLKLLFNEPSSAAAQGVIKTHLGLDLQNVAINVMSRDPGFMARLVSGAVQKGKGAEALFYTKEGQDLLTGAVKSIVQGKVTGANINVITALLAQIWGAGEAEADVVEKLQQVTQ